MSQTRVQELISKFNDWEAKNAVEPVFQREEPNGPLTYRRKTAKMTLGWNQAENQNADIAEAANQLNRFYLKPGEYEQTVSKLKVSERHVKLYSEGVQGYVFVKTNGGMLKPVLLFFHPLRAKLFLIRRRQETVSSSFLSMVHFQEVDAAPDALDYLLTSNADGLFDVVHDIVDLPHMTIWMNDAFSGIKRSAWGRCSHWCSGKKGRRPGQRTLCLIFDEAQHRDSLLLLFSRTAEIHRPPLHFLVQQAEKDRFKDRRQTVKMPSFIDEG